MDMSRLKSFSSFFLLTSLLFAIASAQENTTLDYVVQVNGTCDGACEEFILVSSSHQTDGDCYFEGAKSTIGRLVYYNMLCVTNATDVVFSEFTLEEAGLPIIRITPNAPVSIPTPIKEPTPTFEVQPLPDPTITFEPEFEMMPDNTMEAFPEESPESEDAFFEVLKEFFETLEKLLWPF